MIIDIVNINRQINFLHKWVVIILSISSIGQLLLYPNIDVLFAIVTSFLAIKLLKTFILRPTNLIRFPISTISIFMYVCFFCIMPIPATLLELKPVTYNLRMPQLTFFNVFLLLSDFDFPCCLSCGEEHI